MSLGASRAHATPAVDKGAVPVVNIVVVVAE